MIKNIIKCTIIVILVHGSVHKTNWTYSTIVKTVSQHHWYSTIFHRRYLIFHIIAGGYKMTYKNHFIIFIDKLIIYVHINTYMYIKASHIITYISHIPHADKWSAQETFRKCYMSKTMLLENDQFYDESKLLLTSFTLMSFARPWRNFRVMKFVASANCMYQSFLGVISVFGTFI